MGGGLVGEGDTGKLVVVVRFTAGEYVQEMEVGWYEAGSSAETQ